MNDLEFRVTELDRRLANIIRIGTVDSVDYASATVRVQIGDNLTGDLPWVTRRAGGDVDWWAPEVGEQVIIMSPSGELAQGVVLAALYSNAVPAPATSPDIHTTVYADGFTITHDRAAKHTIFDAWNSAGTIEFRAKNIILKTGDLGFYHIGHGGYAQRITHMGGVNYETETWHLGATVVGIPDYGHTPPEVIIP